MSYGQYTKKRYIKKVGTGELIDLGKYQSPNAGELSNTRHEFWIKGTPIGLERFRVRCHTSDDTSRIYAASNWINLSSLVNPPAANSLQVITATWQSPNINKNFQYKYTMEFDGYTRNAEIFYISLLYDYPFHTYPTGVSDLNAPFDAALTTKFFFTKPLQGT